MNPILTSIQRISDDARSCLTSSVTRESQLSTLQVLIDENHEHLVTLGVGHSALELVKSLAASIPWSLHTKLTGAGGGGCAVTIIPDSTSPLSSISTRSLISSRRFLRSIVSRAQDRTRRRRIRNVRNGRRRRWIRTAHSRFLAGRLDVQNHPTGRSRELGGRGGGLVFCLSSVRV